MKVLKLLTLVALLTLTAMPAVADTPEAAPAATAPARTAQPRLRRYYAEIRGTQSNPASTTVNVTLHPGQRTCEDTGLSRDKFARLLQSMDVKTMVDAMNVMSERGWCLEQSYVVQTGAQLVTIWVISKDAADPDELFRGLLR